MLSLAFSAVKVQLICAWLAFLCLSHAAVSVSSVAQSGIRRLRHWRCRTPISISSMLSQLVCFGV